ncbi:AAA family ATPase [Spirochaeta cellobiosiphila]|uniref:AAA family ATPase n=1 Tax=Spirochaeta cellobiosiphila TaxID=504483 RepID=UPI0004106115|nr:AAA family ATPase [Spirochaeta cellobiosiphila]
MKKIGLTLGKYAPFHKGHQFVIDTALKEVDELIVIIYDTDLIPIPLQVRAKWIRSLYPQVKVIEAWDGPPEVEDIKVVEKQEEEYVSSLIQGINITHFYCSEYYGDHMSKALGAIDRRVDEKRLHCPISATKIRSNPYHYKEYLDPVVYRDMITKVVFMGAMSTGKSTITEALAKRFHTSFAPEYGREYWTTHQIDRRIGFEAFNDIAAGHIEREEIAFAQANKYCFVDTNAITTYMYALDYHGKAPDYLAKVAHENYKRYDLFFLCDDDIPYDDTWDRSGEQKRSTFHKQVIADLKERNIPYIILRGSVEERMAIVEDVLNQYKPYSNFYGQKI